MDDLVNRLRGWPPSIAHNVMRDAADRIEELEAKLAKAVDVIDWVLICWDDHNEHGYHMQGDWVYDARTILAELTGGQDDRCT